jgi:peptidylprolyl isomerase
MIIRVPRFILIVLPLVCCAGWLIAQQGGSTSSPSSQPAGEKHVTPSGLTIVELSPGIGAKNGDIVRIHYTGTLQNGTKFDSSVGKDPIELTLGAAQVIKGWEEGITGMQVGEKRHLTVPPELAYGARGRGDRIPPNATLEFDMELVGLFRQ